MMRRSPAQICARFGPLWLLLLTTMKLEAQIDTAPIEGLQQNPPRVHALTDVRVVASPGVVLESATVILRDGLIEAIGADIEVPSDARVWNLGGHVVYPGFIDSMSELGIPPGLRAPRPRGPDDGPPPEPPEQPADGFWNSRIRPETDVAALLDVDQDKLEAMRSAGITTVLAVPRRGIVRGQSAALNLIDAASPRRMLLAPRIAQHAGAETSGPDDGYPSSLMGVIALLRQSLYDAQWYRAMGQFYTDNPNVERAAPNAALAALEPMIARAQALIFAADDELDYARAIAIADEFDLRLVLYGNGHEYRQTELLGSLERPIIVPVDFPKPPDIDTPDGGLDVSLETLQHWELAPSNPALLAAAGIPFALTADRLDDVADELWGHIRLAIERGLDPDTALAALTVIPAELLGLEDSLGSLEPGKIANLVVADADLFEDAEAEIEIVFVDGDAYPQEAYTAVAPAGRWSVSWPGGSSVWTITERGPALTLSVGESEFTGRVDGEALLLFPAAEIFGDQTGTARLTGYLDDGSIDGLGELPDGTSFAWQADYVGTVAEDDDADEDEANADAEALVFSGYPAGAFGLAVTPARPESVLVRGATIWTSGPAGKLENADLLVRNGRIDAVGQSLDAPRNALVIDGTGKHVTAGLVDAHSHTAISRGINETGSAVTVEVRIADVLDPTDINIYRQLAGGLTSANVMHGSANPMGGQIQTIKLRWGEKNAAGLLFEGAEPGVKFALGENVKQSNWGDAYTTRYPQSRMGVDELIRDTFDAARAYGAARSSAGRNDPPVRRNLRLDAALEILNRQRAIHIHSYRQDEILAFVRLAQEYGLDVAAFQHVLEGYKVGPEIAELGAGGSTFSDWWGYKYEVIDAIPYNGALMRRAGVVVSFNSDDDELATRLNTEAAKAVKYGGVAEEEALRLVTLNPAVQLGIDARVGSLERGKDADFVVWSGDPLSTFTRAEQTWIDGSKYFDFEADAAMRSAAAAERSRLIQKVLEARIDSEGNDPVAPQEQDNPSDIARRSRTDIYSSASYRSHARGEGND